jgi:hypothetical protein
MRIRTQLLGKVKIKEDFSVGSRLKRKWHDGKTVDCSDWRFHVAEREGGRKLLSNGSDDDSDGENEDEL